VTKNLAKLFDLDPKLVAKGLPLEAFLDAIYPDDRPRVLQAIDRTIHDREPYDEEYRTITHTGKVQWVIARGKVEERGGKLFSRE
jgi:PAS domain-containing protein